MGQVHGVDRAKAIFPFPPSITFALLCKQTIACRPFWTIKSLDIHINWTKKSSNYSLIQYCKMRHWRRAKCEWQFPFRFAWSEALCACGLNLTPVQALPPLPLCNTRLQSIRGFWGQNLARYWFRHILSWRRYIYIYYEVICDASKSRTVTRWGIALLICLWSILPIQPKILYSIFVYNKTSMTYVLLLIDELNTIRNRLILPYRLTRNNLRLIVFYKLYQPKTHKEMHFFPLFIYST